MSKAVLVIDMPRDCEECPLYDEYQMRCFYLKNDKYAVDNIPKWCPLKPMPAYDWHEEGKENECEEWYRNGWNACLEEIAENANCSKEIEK